MITAKEARKLVYDATYGKINDETQMAEIESKINEAITNGKTGVSCSYLSPTNHNKLVELGYSVLGIYYDQEGRPYNSINW